MRISIALCILFIGGGAMVRAQQPPLPAVEPPSANPSETPLPEPSVPQLIPADVLPAVPSRASPPSLPQLDEAFKDNPISAAAADYRNRIEWRKLRNIAVNDPTLKAALAEAESAKTDLRKRQLLGRYYKMLYAKMTARAKTPELKTYLAARKNEELGLLPQPHVRPTPTPSPASPTPSPAPTPSPMPSASPRPPELPRAIPGTQ